MRLADMTVEGFRRFADPSKVKLDGRLVAFVGPNEAGKSSLLRALTLLNEDAEFDEDDPTRGGDHLPTVRAGFLLDPEDSEALAGVPGGDTIRYFTCTRNSDNRLIASAEPVPPHDVAPRKALADRLADAAKNIPHIGRLDTKKDDQFARKAFDTAVQRMKSNLDFIGDSALKTLTDLPTALSRAANLWPQETEHCEALLALVDDIETVLEQERVTPHMHATRILLRRRPEFLLFDHKSRNLAKTYDLNTAAPNPPKALENLARLAGLDLMELLTTQKEGVVGRHTSLIERANRRLQEVFSDSWVRPDEVPHLNLQGTVLHLLVRTSDDGYARIDERSDGLRWFVALRAFLSAEDAPSKPVLLVDEAETHLSYDAQASLIDVLSKQQVAQKVLYTTHSAGCLPADLGTGIRPVVPEEGAERSRVENAFWKESPGFTPVLLAMGATALAFTPARNVVIAEGASECLLLPTLLREATEQESLPFQVAPGLSSASAEDIPMLDAEAGRVAYLVDGDKGGSLLGQRVTANGVSDRRVVSLAAVAGKPLTLEDLVAPDVLAEAVNGELADWAVTEDRLASADLPNVGRSRALDGWCDARSIPHIRKTSLAQRIADMRGDDRSLVSDDMREVLVGLHNALLAALDATTR